MTEETPDNVKKRNDVLHLLKNIDVHNYSDTILSILNTLNVDVKYYNKNVLTSPPSIIIEDETATAIIKNLSDIVNLFVRISNMNEDERKTAIECEDVYSLMGINKTQLEQLFNILSNCTDN